MSPEETRAWLILLRAPGLGSAPVFRLLETYPDAASAVAAGSRAWKKLGLADKACRSLEQIDETLIAGDLEWLAGEQCHLIPHTDSRYPERLRQINGPPPALFCLGDPELLGLPQLAIVGSRNATPQGLESARDFAAELARRGMVIGSGLALGVDGAAHEGALSANGLTLAVCGTGLDRVYPPRHRELAHRIAERGLLVSEFLPGSPPKAEHFPRRNRILSGLALGVLVVEAARESGSLITARLAMEQGREVFAIPGSIHNPMARGCHQLIRQGAKLVETVDDILEEIAGPISSYLKDQARATVGPKNGLHPLQNILDALGDAPVTMDQLVERAGLPVETLNAALMQLELEGLVASAASGRLMRLRPV